MAFCGRNGSGGTVVREEAAIHTSPSERTASEQTARALSPYGIGITSAAQQKKKRNVKRSNFFYHFLTSDPRICRAVRHRRDWKARGKNKRWKLSIRFAYVRLETSLGTFTWKPASILFVIITVISVSSSSYKNQQQDLAGFGFLGFASQPRFLMSGNSPSSRRWRAIVIQLTLFLSSSLILLLVLSSPIEWRTLRESGRCITHARKEASSRSRKHLWWEGIITKNAYLPCKTAN